MTDEKIIKALEEFGLPVGNKRIYENELNGEYHYFIFRRGRLSDGSCNRYARQIIVAYVYEDEQKISEFEIINKIKDLGLNFVSMDHDDFQLADTNNWIDMLTFTFTRPERG